MHIFGHARGGWSDRVGYILFVAGVFGVAIHGALRLRSPAARAAAQVPRKRVYLYSRYDRLWHWLMAGSVLVLIVTGLEIHFSGQFRWLSLPRAVRLHNIFAVVLAVNGFLSLFYHVTTNAIRRYFLKRERILEGFLDQARFYTSGIFLGRPHPSPKTPERRLNPLQQVTYLMLLNLLFPLQLATGILIWGASRWPDLADRMGGLTIVAPVHNLGAGLFSAFLVMHIYLTTTGHTPTSNIRAMVSGYDEIEPEHPPQEGESHA
jgi:thiosulfate reductase cytochrome b subunit